VRAHLTYEPLADLYGLTPAERRKRNPNYPSMVVWWNRVQWARQYLKDDGFLRSASRGIWQVTDAGREELRRYGLLQRPFPAPLHAYAEPVAEQMPTEPEPVVLSEDDYELWQRIVEFAETRADDDGVFPMTYQEVSDLADGRGYGATLIAPLERAGLIEKVGKRYLQEEEDPLQTSGGRVSSLWKLNRSCEVLSTQEAGVPSESVSSKRPQTGPDVFERSAPDLPSCKEIAMPLLHFMANHGGTTRPKDAIDALGDFFGLSPRVREARYDSVPNLRRWDSRVHTAMQVLKNNGHVASAGRGLWKVTREGERELRQRGLLSQSFPALTPGAYAESGLGGRTAPPRDLVSQVASEVLANGVCSFPEDFLPERPGSVEFREIEVPPVKLRLAPHSKMKIVAPGLPFRYECKNPVEAAYILFAHRPGERCVRLPCGNLLLYRMVSDYRQYIRVLRDRILNRLAELTLDGERAAELARHVFRRVGLPDEI